MSLSILVLIAVSAQITVDAWTVRLSNSTLPAS